MKLVNPNPRCSIIRDADNKLLYIYKLRLFEKAS